MEDQSALLKIALETPVEQLTEEQKDLLIAEADNLTEEDRARLEEANIIEPAKVEDPAPTAAEPHEEANEANDEGDE